MKNYEIYHQSVFEKWPIEDNSIQAIITSPPYWGLRKYNIPDIVIDDWKGQYGLESSYKDYIKHTLLWVKEARRVLKDDGIFFLNIGDNYNGSGKSGNYEYAKKHTEFGKPFNIEKYSPPTKEKSLANKCKMLIPHRIAIALIDEGWILRNDIVWTKGNCMPESCQDRFSKKWESIFMFVKNTKYYFDLVAVKEPTKTKDNIVRDRETTKLNNTPGRAKMMGLKENNYDFKNPGDVWNINTTPSSEKHYAMWNFKLVERMLLCSTKENDIILDPFCGSATTLKVVIENRRKAIGIDLGYKDIQERKLEKIQIKMV